MIQPKLNQSYDQPALRRLAELAPLDLPAQAALRAAVQYSRTIAPRRELLVEGKEIRDALLILDGWAARVRVLNDGRRQIINLILPGDFVGLCDQAAPVASSTVVALTELTVCTAPPADTLPVLAEIYALSRARKEAYLMAQIVRLGRMNAHERITDLFLELLERLELAGLAQNGRFRLPLTQELVADVVGLTSVHVNRMLQHARARDELSWTERTVHLNDPEALRRFVGRPKMRVNTGA